MMRRNQERKSLSGRWQSAHRLVVTGDAQGLNNKLANDNGLIHEKDHGGRPLVFHAGQAGQLKTAKILVANGADKDWGLAGYLQRPLFLSNRAEEPEEKEYWLAGYSGKALPDGSTTLIWAIRKGWIKELKDLIAQGASPLEADHRGVTPAMWAARENHPEMLGMLQAAGADMGAKGGKYGNTPAHEAVYKHGNRALRALLAMGLDINQSNLLGETPLMRACQLGNQEGLGIILETKKNLDARDHKGRTALYFAVCNGHEECALALSAAGAKVDLGTGRFGRGKNPLVLAQGAKNSPRKMMVSALEEKLLESVLDAREPEKEENGVSAKKTKRL